MSSIRQQKVERLLQKRLGNIFTSEVKIEGFSGMITVTAVRISPDLSFAKVYLSVFPGDDAKKVLEVVRNDQSTIRGILGRKVGKELRIVPELAFYLDDSLDYAENIDNLLSS